MNTAADIDRIRDISLGSILEHFGLMPHREGSTTRYKNDQFNIVVSHGNLWFDNAAAVGGRGAIDLTLHVKYGAKPRTASTHDLQGALDWLSSFQPDAVAMMPSPQQSAPPVRESFADQSARLALRDDERWPIVHHYLTQTRRLPEDFVQSLYDKGDLYPSFSQEHPARTGACFVHRNLNGEARGATIRNAVPGAGSSFSIGEKSGAWFTLGDSKTATQAILVEAPIDAISFAAIKQPDRTVILAMSCANVFRPVLAAAHERHWPLTVAFDNDSAGHTGWERCMENHHLLYPNDPPPNRATPRAKDWNEDLCAAPRRNHRRRL